MNKLALLLFAILMASPFSKAWAGTAIPLTVNLSEAVTVTGTPRVAVDVGGQTRYATYASGSGTSALTFTLSPQAGDVDLDGITVSSPIDLNGGTMKDAAGNDLASLTFTPPNTSGIKVNYPSLGMDFVYDADGRYTLNGTVYNDLTSFLAASGGTFTRASIGTYYDSAGTLQTAAANTPRFDYDPVTHAAKGILLEDSRTNGVVRSSELDNAAWSKNAVTVTPDVAAAPDGTMTADKVVPTTASWNYRTVQQATPSLVTGSSYTVTAYAKAAGYNYATIVVAGNNGRATFDLTTGASTSYAVATTSSTNVGNGWWRLIFKFNSILTGATSVWLGAVSSYTDPYTNYVGDGSSGVYLWGLQFESGKYPTSYIPTTSAAVTRPIDLMRFPIGGWFNLSESSVFLQSSSFGNEALGRFSVGAGSSSSNYFGLAYVTSVSFPGSFYYRSSGSGPVIDGNPVFSFNTTFKTAGSYSVATDSAAIAKNGTLSSTGNGVTSMAPATYFYVGTSPFSPTYVASGHYQKMMYYPLNVSNTQLRLLTQ